MLNIQIEFDELLKVIDQLSDEQKRVAGLGEGKIWMSDDFDDPLPDEFWFGDDA